MLEQRILIKSALLYPTSMEASVMPAEKVWMLRPSRDTALTLVNQALDNINCARKYNRPPYGTPRTVLSRRFCYTHIAYTYPLPTYKLIRPLLAAKINWCYFMSQYFILDLRMEREKGREDVWYPAWRLYYFFFKPANRIWLLCWSISIDSGTSLDLCKS